MRLELVMEQKRIRTSQIVALVVISHYEGAERLDALSQCVWDEDR